MQSATEDVYDIPVYPQCFVEGISVIYAKPSEKFHAPEVEERFTPLMFGSTELKSLQAGDVVWIVREISPDVMGFTKWITRRVVRMEDQVRIYYGDGYLKTISKDMLRVTTYVVRDESSLLLLVKQIGSRAIGYKFS